MLTGRASVSAIGKTRVCPHCKTTILESETICPACRHHLHFNVSHSTVRTCPSFNAFSIEGTVTHPSNEPRWEYSLMIVVRNEKGQEVQREVVSVGGLSPGEGRSVTLNMEVFKPG